MTAKQLLHYLNGCTNILLSSNKDANPSFSVTNVISLEYQASYYIFMLCVDGYKVVSNYHLWDGISRQKTLLEETFACGKEVKLNKCTGSAKHTLSKKGSTVPQYLAFVGKY